MKTKATNPKRSDNATDPTHRMSSGLATGLVFVAVLLAGIFVGTSLRSDSAQPVETGGDPRSAKVLELIDREATLHLRLRARPATMSPLFASQDEDLRIRDFLFDQMFVYDAESNWMPNDAMVKSFSESADGMSATVELRDGVMWHDGRPFSPDDVLFSWRQYQNENIPTTQQGAASRQIKNVIAVGDTKLRFNFHKPSGTSRQALMFPVVPKHIYHPHRTSEAPFQNMSDAEVMTGNGPYRFVEWQDNRLILEKWASYHGPEVHFKQVAFEVIPDNDAARRGMLSASIDEMSLTPDQYLAEAESAEFKRVANKFNEPMASTNSIAWNLQSEKSFLADARVRSAFAHAVNVNLISEKVFHGLATPAAGVFAPGSPAHDSSMKPISYDPERAASLLDEAGWLMNAQDGIRYQNGKPMRFSIMVAQQSTVAQRWVRAVADMLKEIGVVMELELPEVHAYFDRRANDEYDAITVSWISGRLPDEDNPLWTTSGIREGYNRSHYSNLNVDQLFARAAAETDQPKRRVLFREIERTIIRDQPVLLVTHGSSLWAFNKRLHGVSFGPTGPFHFHPGPRAWWAAKTPENRH
jgi:peptide/nickel transport system substrate-binding protein